MEANPQENPLDPISSKKRPASHYGPYPPDQRRQAVEAFHKSKMNVQDFAKTWGVSYHTMSKWVTRYEKDGPKGLERKQYRSAGRHPRRDVRAEITEVKRKFPDFGLRKVKDFLYRFHGVKVSTGSVRNALQETGMDTKVVRRRRRKIQPPRRFERSKAGDLWQSDITSFLLPRRHERVYLTVFLDDYSRYIVSWGLYLHQKQDIVVETLLDGIERFGKPKEVLTDQGRQYFTWRGKGDFQKLLIRQGIQHVVARTHHPQTVGKTERFWATVGEEFWDRVQPQDFTEAKERLGHFVAHYNHFRPHQGIDGMVPADRFFGVADQVRAALEQAMSRNELHLALGEKPRRPVFLVGQVGDQQVSLHGEKGRLIFQTNNGNVQEMGLEGLGIPGGKDGNGNGSGRDDAGEETQETEAQKPPIQITHERAPIGEGAVGRRDGGREAESPQGGGRHPGELDGPVHPIGNSQEVGSTAVTGVADVPAGTDGVGGGVVEAAQGSEGHDTTSPAPGGGPQAPEKEDRQPGEGLGNDEGVGGPTKGISSQPGAENKT